MANTKYRLRSRTNKNVSIYIVLSLGRGKKYQTTTGFSINPNDWKENVKNSSKQHGFPKNSKLIEIKKIKSNLIKLDSFIDGAINSANANGETINTDWLKLQINTCFNRNKGIEEESNLLIDYIQNIIDNADTKVLQNGKIGLSKNRIKGYITFKGVINKFQKHIKKKIYFSDINISLEKRFREWLIKTQDYKINYANKNFDNLKAVCNEATRDGKNVNPHAKNLLSFSDDKKNKVVITLSFEELEQIEELELQDEALINARKYILIGCFTSLRYGDLVRLKPKNIIFENGLNKIEIKQEKTDKNVVIPILPVAERVLENGLPYMVTQQLLNKQIKTVCKLAGIDEVITGYKFTKISKNKNRKIRGKYPKYELITTHTFRRSFATNHYKHVPTPVIMGVTGHSRESTFLAYIGKPVDEDANAKLLLDYSALMNKKKEKANKIKTIKLVVNQ